jgi:hypothetical protein
VASEPKVSQGKVLERYEYWFWSRHVGAVWGGIWLMMALFFPTLMAVSLGKDTKLPIIPMDFWWWGLWGFFIMFALYAEKRFTSLLQPVTLTEEGIVAHIQRLDFEFWPKRKLGLMRWNEIERIELIRWPHVDADQSTFKPSALRIVADDRKIVIHRKIRGYKLLCDILEEQMRKHNKALKMSLRRARFD